MTKIRSKLFALFMLLIGFIVIIGVLTNVVLLEPYYIFQNKNQMKAISNEIENAFYFQKSDLSNVLQGIQAENGVNCLVYDPKTGIIYDPFPIKMQSKSNRLPKEYETFLKDPDSQYLDWINEKSNDATPKLMHMSKMQNGELILIKKPMKGIRESVGIANQFYLFAGLLTMMIGGIIVFWFAKRLTTPIIQMAEVSEEISKLSFHRMVEIQSKDEIGMLGKSINQISIKLSESLNKLRNDLERRKQLLRDLSHELKTPIGIIKGYIEALKFGVVNDPEKQKKYYDVIISECDHMNEMISELLNYSKMESSQFELINGQITISQLFVKVTERFQKMIEDRSIQLSIHLSEQLELYANPELIERCLNNFLLNAINHASAEKQIRLSAFVIPNGIRFEVFNSGNHLLQEDLQKIWDIYYKVDQSRTKTYGGHGLGLAIIKQIVLLHHGQVGVENIDHGVLFWMEIPNQSGSGENHENNG